MLSYEAIIALHPPRYIKLSGNSAYRPPALSWLTGNWYITHSTHIQGGIQRDLHVNLSLADDRKGLISKTTHQGYESSEPKSQGLAEQAVDLNKDTASQFQQVSTGSRWEVLAWGKEGQLQSWMIEDGDGWISDPSGERRGDWRNSYLVVYRDGHGEKDPAGIEVWDRFGSRRPLSGETLEKIRAALRDVENDHVKTLAEKLTKC